MSILAGKGKKRTEGPILRGLLVLSVPLVFANILETSYQLVNTFWVGRLSANAVAAISVSFPIILLLITLVGGLTAAGCVLVAQYAGAGDRVAVIRIAAQVLLIGVAASIIFAAIAYVETPKILRLMNVEAEIYEETATYMRISFLGNIFLFISITSQSIIASAGEVRVPLYLAALGVIINILLDPIFIFGWGTIPAGGVEGSAWAALIAQILSAAAGLYFLIGKRCSARDFMQYFNPDFRAIKRILLLGLPATVDGAMQTLGITIMTVIAAEFGTLTIAAYGIAFRVFAFVLIPAIGISMAATILVGQNIGAGDNRRAELVTIASGWTPFIILTIVGLVIYSGAEAIVRFFVPNDPLLIEMAPDAVRCIALSFGLHGAYMGLAGAFRGAGDTVFSMIVSIVSIWAVQIPFALFLSRDTLLGSEGLWLSYLAAGVVAVLLFMARLKSVGWKRSPLSNPLNA